MKNRFRRLLTKVRAVSAARRWLVLVAAFAGGVLILGQFPGRRGAAGIPAISEFQQKENELAGAAAQSQIVDEEDLRKDLPDQLAEAAKVRERLGRELGAGVLYTNPLIAHTASLAMSTKEFAKSRTSLEEILERHRGYAARLRMAGRRTGSVLLATLRVPSPELGATVNELKSLGEVEQEEQAADEITQQRADLEARLSNAQGTLRRLEELLKKQTYPDGNVRELQRQIASASAEVNRLQAERVASEHRVIFANVQFSLREEMAQPAETLGSQLHSAAAAGFGQAAASISSLLLFFIGRGPVVLLWMAILYVPVRFVWKRWQPVAVPGNAPVPGT
jgi:DNA repair exonuclease SbcCD ATPase subunit